MKTALLLLALLTFSPFARATQSGIDLPALDQELQTNGLRGWIHGAAPEFDQYVFTWRDPNDFFLHFEFPLITSNPAVKAELAKLTRHDEVVVKGKFANLNAPVKHIRVRELALKSKFNSGIKVPPYHREAKLPQDLVGKKDFIGKVHGVVEDGRILAVEYKDAVVPVYVADTALTKDLFRNDKIKLHYVLRQSPGLPSHVELDPAAPKAIEVLDRMIDEHGKALAVEGELVLFPKSPQIIFNIFAIQTTDADGVKREHTVINFDDPAAFKAIRDKLQAMWDAESATAIDGRNKFVNPNIIVRATGTGNVVDPGQANPQVLLKSEADIVRVKKP